MCVAACGDNLAADVSGDAGNERGRFQPWTVGSTWTYDELQPGNGLRVMSTMTVLEQVVLDGHPAFRVHTGEFAWWGNSPIDQYWSRDLYEGHDGDLDVRYRTDFFGYGGGLLATQVETPYRLRLDENAAPSSSAFLETTMGPVINGSFPRSRVDDWRVISTDEIVTVPAGTFHCLHVQRYNPNKTRHEQDYWYARGIGKIQELNGAHIERLTSYSIAPSM